MTLISVAMDYLFIRKMKREETNQKSMRRSKPSRGRVTHAMKRPGSTVNRVKWTVSGVMREQEMTLVKMSKRKVY